MNDYVEWTIWYMIQYDTCAWNLTVIMILQTYWLGGDEKLLLIYPNET